MTLENIKKSLFIIQPIDFCNLNCSYCYLPGRRNTKRMSSLVLNEVINKICTTKCIDEPIVGWHSGEPLTAGRDFFERALSLFLKHDPEKRIQHNLQTNATLIDKHWLSLFKKNDFMISLSVDGPAFIHDHHRTNWSKKGSHARVQQSIDLMRSEGYPLHAIAVLTDYSLDYPEDIFFYFLENGFTKLALSADEVVSSHNESTIYQKGDSQAYQLERYRKFMTKMFELWFEHKDKIEIREFSNMIEMLALMRELKYDCNRGVSTPLRVITIDLEGTLYTFSPELATGTPENRQAFSVGNIFEINDFEDILLDDTFKRINEQILSGVDNCRTSCEYFDVCHGGSPANKFYETGRFESTETMHCNFHTKTVADIILSRLPVHANNVT